MKFGQTGGSKNQQFDFQNAAENIDKFNSDVVDYLYDLEPQSQNLFMIANFSEQGEGDDAIKELYNAQFRCRSIEIPSLSFSIDIDALTHVPVFSEATYSQEVRISWMEDVYHSIWKYHDDWMRRWYDKTYNVLRCGVAGKFRKLDLIAYHYANKSGAPSIFETPVAEPIFVCMIGGLVPTELPSMKFDYDNDGNDEKLEITYKAARIDIRYNKLFTNSSNALYDTGAASKGAKVSDDVWSAKGVSAEGYEASDTTTYEQLRITRASTTRYDSMPRLV